MHGLIGSKYLILESKRNRKSLSGYKNAGHDQFGWTFKKNYDYVILTKKKV